MNRIPYLCLYELKLTRFEVYYLKRKAKIERKKVEI